jgi:plasmid stabilization system protein ParE
VRLTLQPAAREDILRLYRYYLVDKDAEAAAERYLEAVQAAIEAMCLRPGIGAHNVLGNPDLSGLRSWPVSSAVRIYYLSSETLVRILRVLHGKSDIDPLLEEEAMDPD